MNDLSRQIDLSLGTILLSIPRIFVSHCIIVRLYEDLGNKVIRRLEVRL